MNLRLLFATLLALTFCSAHAQTSSIIVSSGSQWKYWDKGNEPAGWESVEFVEPVGSEWSTGAAELGYGDGDEATVVGFGPSSTSKFITTYFRKSFDIADPQAFSNLRVKLWRDDGAVVYLNGVEIARYNLPAGDISFSTPATTAIEETMDQFSAPLSLLRAGANVLAVEMHQSSGSSSDISFDLELSAPGPVVRGPYLQLVTTSSAIVRWRTAFPTESVVRYGTQPDKATWTSTSAAALTTEHEITVTGLTSNTRYFYSIGNNATEFIAEATFYTAPDRGSAQPIRIWALGDSGTADVNAAAVRDAYYNYRAAGYTDVLLMLGDNAYNNGLDSEYQAAVFDMYPEMLRETPLWPTLGNHDTAGSTVHNPSYPYFAMFTLPTQAEAGGLPSGTENYYSLDYGNIHFICLDSMTSSRQPGSAMLTWLEADLANNTLPWVIAYWHHPPYSKGSHDSDNRTAEYQLVEMRENVVPILEAYNVDLILGGHSHSYERSYLLNGHHDISSTLTAAMKLDSGSGHVAGSGAYNKETGATSSQEGAVYVVAGSSGKKSGGALNHPAMFTSQNELGSLVIDVNGNKLDVRFLRENGAVTDYFTIVKGNARPTITLTSPSADATFIAPATINLAAEASDSDGSIVEVSFFSGATLLNTVATAPYAFDWSGVAAGTYSVTALARDNLGVTKWSAPVTFTVTATPPAAPETLVATAAGSSQINLSWSDRSTDETGFSIQRSLDGIAFNTIATVGANIVSYSNTGLTPNTLYYYRVLASNSGGSSAPSNVAEATTADAAPAAPTNLAATAISKTEIRLTWVDASSNESAFEVYRKSGGTFTRIATLPSGTTGYNHTGLAANTPYTYRVRAINAFGASAFSNDASVKTLRK